MIRITVVLVGVLLISGCNGMTIDPKLYYEVYTAPEPGTPVELWHMIAERDGERTVVAKFAVFRAENDAWIVNIDRRRVERLGAEEGGSVLSQMEVSVRSPDRRWKEEPPPPTGWNK